MCPDVSVWNYQFTKLKYVQIVYNADAVICFEMWSAEQMNGMNESTIGNRIANFAHWK